MMTTEPNESWGWPTDYDDVSGAVAICGVGESDHTKASGRTVTEIVGPAVERALADAGLEPTDVDGLMYIPLPEQFDVAAFHEYFGTDHDIWESSAGGGMRWAATAPYERGPGAARRARRAYVLNTFGVAWATQRSADGRRSGAEPRAGAVQAEPRDPDGLVPPARLLRHDRAAAHARVRHHRRSSSAPSRSRAAATPTSIPGR